MQQQEKRTPELGKNGIVLLLISLAAAAVYQFARPNLLILSVRHLPGMGLTLTQWMILLTALLLAAKEGRLRLRKNGAGMFLLVSAIALGACYGIFGNDRMRLMNLPPFIFLTIQALFSLTNANERPGLSFQGLWEGFRRFFSSLFLNVALPFQTFFARVRGTGQRKTGLWLGLLLGGMAAAAAVALLSSADGVFSAMVRSAFQAMGQINGALMGKLVLALLGGLLLFSLLYAALRPEKHFDLAAGRTAPPLTLTLVLGMLTAVYALFVYVQFRYLFGNEQTVKMAGGYAEYARSGFFQLVLLAFLTLAGILAALCLCPKSRSVRVLCAVVTLLTLVIDFSAFFRMRLYIQAYGLTLLRVLTLWAMAAILAALVLALGKCVCPSFQLTPPLAAVVVLSWLALNYASVDAQIARYNVTAYNSGALEELDVDYLGTLSPDALPALEKIEDSTLREQAQKRVEKALMKDFPCPYDWSLSWLKTEK